MAGQLRFTVTVERTFENGCLLLGAELGEKGVAHDDGQHLHCHLLLHVVAFGILRACVRVCVRTCVCACVR